MVTQILNFGCLLPSTFKLWEIDLQGNRQFADKLLARVKYVSGGTTDLRIQQPLTSRSFMLMSTDESPGNRFHPA